MAALGGCGAVSEGDAGDELAQENELVPRIATAPTIACPPSSGELRWPISGELQAVTGTDLIQDVYGGIIRSGSYYNHGGVDFRAPSGTPIHAVADGFVTRKCVWNYDTGTSSCSGHAGKGNFLVIQHFDLGPNGETLYTTYAHMLDFDNGGTELVEGDCVASGDVIGRVGQSGTAANTVHLHLSLHANLSGARSPTNSNSLDPWLALPQSTSSLGYDVAALGPDGNGDLQLAVQVDVQYADLGRIEVVRLQSVYCIQAPCDPVERDLRALDWSGTGVLACGPSCGEIEVVPTDFDPGTYQDPSDPGDLVHEWMFVVGPANAVPGDEIYRVYDVHGQLVATGQLD